MKVGLLGTRGFIGQAVGGHARAVGYEVADLPRIDVRGGEGRSVQEAEEWKREHLAEYWSLVERLSECDAVINAAGLAEPGSRDRAALVAANAVVPRILAEASHEAGVPRFVQVSSAAVQGRMEPLNEEKEWAPRSVYAASKAAGERALLGATGSTPEETVIYRATSVQGETRSITRRLFDLANRRAVPLGGRGYHGIPAALVENVGAAVVHLATCRRAPQVVLHPWEGMTARAMVKTFNPGARIIPLPRRALGAWFNHSAGLTVRYSKLDAAMRRVEIVMMGQGQRAQWLPHTGFLAPVGLEGWTELGRMLAARPHAQEPG